MDSNLIRGSTVQDWSRPGVVLNSILIENKLNICHFNAQSLGVSGVTKFEEIKAVFTGTKASVICVSETWLRPTVSSHSFTLEDFEFFSERQRT